MTKTLSIAAFAAALLITGSSAMAEEYLETTGSRKAPQAAQTIYLQDRAPVRQQATRRYYNQAVAQQPGRATEERAFDRADGIPGNF